MRRLFCLLFSFYVTFSPQSVAASDWVDDPVQPAPFSNPASSNASTIHSGAGIATPGTIASSGLQLHFAQAIDALELEIFAQKNKKVAITERLDLLERAIFGTTKPQELSNNVQRLHRLLSIVPLPITTVAEAAGGIKGGSASGSLPLKQNKLMKSLFRAPRDAASGVNTMLHSPTFWTLVGVAGVLVCGYLLASRSSPAYGGGPYYEGSPCSGYVNSNSHYVRGYYDKLGNWHQPHMQTNSNGTMTDNFSALCNVNPYTGQIGYVPSLR